MSPMQPVSGAAGTPPMRFYHGAAAPIEQLLPGLLADHMHPLGPGIYMTTSFDVAARYARHPGGVYELLLPLDPTVDQAIIDLDAPFRSQRQCVQDVTRSFFPQADGRSSIALLEEGPFQALYRHMVTAVDRYLPSLLQQGVWGCRGHMPASLSSGAMDQGLQLISLRPETIALGPFSPASSLCPTQNHQPG